MDVFGEITLTDTWILSKLSNFAMDKKSHFTDLMHFYASMRNRKGGAKREDFYEVITG